ncbi:MAG: hypothetical protein IPM54_37445 [Polyangiaceae bacterium]|nr:hypothetical protein [Polyangiaceae bacterium]
MPIPNAVHRRIDPRARVPRPIPRAPTRRHSHPTIWHVTEACERASKLDINIKDKLVSREARRNAALPKDIDAQIFGYFDVLEEQREAANRVAKAAKGKSETPVTEGT